MNWYEPHSVPETIQWIWMPALISWQLWLETGGGDQATSRTIFKNLLNWELNPREGRFNGYDTIHTYEEDVFLGYALLNNGDHEITFEVVEPGQGGGYKIGIDQLMASPASTPNEGESLTVESQVGTSASVLLDRQAKGNFQLHFPATQKGHKFSVTVHNDKWVETNFEDPASIENVEIEFNEKLIPNDIVVRLAGMEPAWNASRQTGSLSYGTPGLDLNGTVVRQLQKGDSILNGGFIEAEGKRSRLIFKASNAQAFRIANVYFGISASDEAINMGYRYTPEQLKLTSNAGTESSAFTIPAGQSITSSWSNVEITSTNNYLVTYTIADNVNRDSPALWPDYNVASNSVLSSTRLAFVGEGASYTAASLAQEADNWDFLSNTNGLTIHSPLYGIGLEAIQICYAPTGSFTSQILDTTLASPTFQGFTSNSETPGGSSIQFKVRTGNDNDLSDASDWDLIDPSSQIMDANKRYLQFQAILESDTSHTETPILKDVTFNWSGETRMVNIGGTFNKGPDHGVFEISVDGQKLTSALIVDMEIYQDVRAMNNTTRRIQSKQKVEISPRNTGF